MEKYKTNSFKEFSLLIANKLMDTYWGPLYKYLSENKELIKTFTGFLLNHDKIIFYFGKTHLAIEYFGNERIDKLKPNGVVEFMYQDLTTTDDNFLEQIIGFKFDSTMDFEFPLPPFSEDLIIPTDKGWDKLIELNWNFIAQDSIMTMNAGNFVVPKNQRARFVNSLFFDADENGLTTRHIKWIDFIPLLYDDTGEDIDNISINLNFFDKELIKFDANYVYPLPDKNDFKYSKLPQINRFIELAGSEKTSEPKITAFLNKTENKFILTMAFLAKNVHHQLLCEWQSEEKTSIQPDFFAVQADGYGNIIEFKLPQLKSKVVTGRPNRETFSAEINSYISQTRNYKSYFEDPNNRKWFENKYGFKVHHPKRILVVGRRWDFMRDEWKEIISDYKDIEILTYDDLVDGVIAQFYI